MAKKEKKRRRRRSRPKRAAADAAPARSGIEKEMLPALAKKLGRTNPLSLPRLQKIVVNMGVGSAIAGEEAHGRRRRGADADHRPEAAGHARPASRSPISSSAKDMPIGCKVTLRGTRMYEFLDRLISLALPRVRDFRGLDPNAFDGHGNYNLGLTEQLVFPGVESRTSSPARRA